ncbi:FAD-binding oxidoreductase [Undibacterium sp. TJN25]|uniref:FAD-binding oxidoreductase n=1 Tax=Undibacterium sp. TJN25 TaxID=3413056 RepID=UPI003BF27DBF
MIEQQPAPVAGIRWQTAKVAGIRRITPRLKSFTLVPATSFVFQAGQHVDLRLTAEDGYSAMRSYSIASSPTNPDALELAIERLDNGEVSSFFHDVVAVGDEVELRGPLGGHFIWKPADGGPLLLAGGGSGVVPLLAMIRQQQAQAAMLPTALLLSARRWEDLPYREELLEFQHAKNGFFLSIALTREIPRRDGDYGRRVDMPMVTAILARLPGVPKHIFVCGSNSFVNAAADGAIAAGIPAGTIRTERYGG